MPLVLVTKPGKEPVSLEMAKEHLRVDDNDSDGYIGTLIFVARQYAEHYLRRALITQTFDYYLDGFSNAMEIPRGKLQSVTHVKYIDTNGDTQTLASSVYSVNTYADPGIVELGYSQSWPSVRDVSNTVNIRFVCGYGTDQEDVPEAIRQAILIHISTLYENRESTSQFQIFPVYMSYEALMYPYRIFNL